MRELRVVEKLDLRAANLDRNSWPIHECIEARKRWESCQEGFHDKNLVMSTDADPGMSLTISARPADNKTSAVPKAQELPPCPEGKIFTIAPPGLFELLGRHPMVSQSELFGIGNVPAG